MPDILRRASNEVMVIDGAMGTMLQRAGAPVGGCNELLNVTAPEMVLQVQRDYVLAGADAITSNSFGGSRTKLAEYGLADRVEELNRAAVRIAREAGAVHVLGDIGPTGRVLEPLGDATFDELFEVFAEQASALAAESPDAIIIETMTDLAEARCALLATRSVTDTPVIVSLTFGPAGRTDLSGTDPETAAVVLEACGASVVGMNCGLGPEQMLPLVERFARATTLPIVAQPNAGMPRLQEGETVFPGTADDMGQHAARFVGAGATFVGSCCGSTPTFTGAIVDFAKQRPLAARWYESSGLAIASGRQTLRVGGWHRLAILGERINPTGKKRLADSLLEGSLSVVREYAVDQQHDGADALDVNVGAAGVDAVKMLPEAVKALAALTDLPLVLDNTDAAALEPALKAYAGRALVNSVNGGEESMASILPLAKRYGAAVLVLALDDTGIPETVSGRVEIVERVRRRAHQAGLTDADLIVDCLTLTAATDPAAAQTTVDAVRAVSKDLGLTTALGVSNVSHGLPGRPVLNVAFLAMAAAAGLDAAIINPGDLTATLHVSAADALLGRDEQARRWIARVQAEAASGRPVEGGGSRQDRASVPAETPGPATPRVEGAPHPPSAVRLQDAIATGDLDGAWLLVDEVISDGTPPERVIADVLTPAIQALGDAFGRGEVFLPQLMTAADAMKAAVARVRTHLPDSAAAESEGRVVFATVKGDIHSIGKDICVSLLQSQGFDVVDMGVDVPAEEVAARAEGADAVCLSALMTTTLPAMEHTVRAVDGSGARVLVGGAVVTEDYARSIGAGYAADAPGCVVAVRRAVAEKRDAP